MPSLLVENVLGLLEAANCPSEVCAQIVKKIEAWEQEILYSELNKLLGFLEAFEVVRLVEENFLLYNNPAPPLLLKSSIAKLQEILNKCRPTE